MTILDLLYSRGIKPQRVATTKGGEYQSPCPLCQGRDCFHAWPSQGEGGTWWCRRCDKGGDLIEFLRHFDGLSFPEACRRLGLEKNLEYRRLPVPARRARAETFSGVDRPQPPAAWLEKAEKLIAAAEKAIFDQHQVLTWLERRGLEAVDVAAHRLGWLPGDKDQGCCWRPRSAWGLEDIETERDGVKRLRKKLWIPRGLVIPTLIGGRAAALRLRLTEADRKRWSFDKKYYVVPGSFLAPLVAVSSRLAGRPRAWVVVESQLDALMVAERCADSHPIRPVGAMAMLSNTGKPCPRSHQLLAAAERVLVALDYDLAGKKGADWWLKTYRQAVRWPVPQGKDPGEYFALGGNIHEWINEGLPSNLKVGI